MKNKDKTIVPKLRFKEFEHLDGVSLKHGDSLFDYISDKNHNSDLPILAITQEQGAIPREQIDYNVSVTEKSISSYKVVDIGDYIISLRSFQGGIEYSSYKGICSPAYIILRKKNNLVNEYYKFYFKSYKFIQDMNKHLEGIRDGKMVSYEQFSKLLLPYPLKDEQQKIADCLTTLDELITAENKKLELLKDHKKGLMQKLFPAEGKAMPEWRFPEFRSSGEWKFVEINDIGEIITGKTPSTNDSSLWNGDIQFVTPTDITEEKYQLTTSRTVAHINKMKILPIGTVMFTCIASIGKMSISTQLCITNQQINSIIPYANYDSSFIYYILSSMVNSIKELAGKQAVPIINKTLFSSIEINIPNTFEEQQKIADCLSSVDRLISEQSKKIDELKEHKKGLMQGLFPSLEEVE